MPQRVAVSARAYASRGVPMRPAWGGGVSRWRGLVRVRLQARVASFYVATDTNPA